MWLCMPACAVVEIAIYAFLAYGNAMKGTALMNMYMYVYICTYMHVCVYTLFFEYIYIIIYIYEIYNFYCACVFCILAGAFNP